MTQPALELKDVIGRSALGDIGYEAAVSFKLLPGEIGVILGGKETSSLFRLILGSGQLSSGEILLDGRVAIDRDADERAVLNLRKQIGFGFRDRGLLSNLSILDNVDLPAKYHGRYTSGEEPGSHGKRVLAELGVDPALWRLRPSHVTWEERKLVLLARAIVLSPKVLVLDDPSAMFASIRVPDLMIWLATQKARGMAILIGTNDYPFGLAVASWVLHPKRRVAVDRYDDFIDPTWIESAKILGARMPIA